jgi:hypothetical protein
MGPYGAPRVTLTAGREACPAELPGCRALSRGHVLWLVDESDARQGPTPPPAWWTPVGASGPGGSADSNSYIGCQVNAELWSDGGRDFPPPSLRPTPPRAGRAETGGDTKGRPKLSAGGFRTSRPRIGTGKGCQGTCGEPNLRSVKSPANAYPGSNPGPATSATTSADMVTVRARSRNPPGRGSLRFRSAGRPADAAGLGDVRAGRPVGGP